MIAAFGLVLKGHVTETRENSLYLWGAGFVKNILLSKDAVYKFQLILMDQ